uniref:LanC-like protein n=1 Tax=Acrobeloides nanus TaxID=290746 RepID=A0A914C0U1_9BILA
MHYAKKEVIIPERLRLVLYAVIRSGREYAAKRKYRVPLMYQYHGTEYLGAAHGLAGILQMLMSFHKLLTPDELQDVRYSVEFLLSLKTLPGHITSSMDIVGHNEGENQLVHWCHGAPGVIQTFITAYLVFGDQKYLQASRDCAEFIWERGILTKGPGICHGVAGNGYAFLLMYRVTGEQLYLDRAKAFAAVMMDPNFKKSAKTPDFPYSLYEGWAGSLCFLTDLVNPENAQFPLFHIPF